MNFIVKAYGGSGNGRNGQSKNQKNGGLKERTDQGIMAGKLNLNHILISLVLFALGVFSAVGISLLE